ncbi:MAG: hypothetical protein GYB53_19545 [Rhodobacteraceae bacterium]|nr:hypothetical protein [Paracoccaceae bacterium]MBR9823239.1 hypothetical protein [Paracoccaceae bacterium]
MTCSGSGTGFDAPGAEITEPESEAIRADERLDLTNHGTITSDENDGIYALDGSNAPKTVT